MAGLLGRGVGRDAIKLTVFQSVGAIHLFVRRSVVVWWNCLGPVRGVVPLFAARREALATGLEIWGRGGLQPLRISHGEAGGKAWRAAGDVPSEAKERLRGGREGRSRGELGNEEREDVAGLASGWGPDVRVRACTAVGGFIATRGAQFPGSSNLLTSNKLFVSLQSQASLVTPIARPTTIRFLSVLNWSPY